MGMFSKIKVIQLFSCAFLFSLLISSPSVAQYDDYLEIKINTARTSSIPIKIDGNGDEAGVIVIAQSAKRLNLDISIPEEENFAECELIQEIKSKSKTQYFYTYIINTTVVADTGSCLINLVKEKEIIISQIFYRYSTDY